MPAAARAASGNIALTNFSQPRPILNQIGPGLVQDARVHGQTLADGPVAVIAQPGRIGDGDQEQIQCRSAVADTLDMPIMDQAMIDPTELARDLADTIGDNGTFRYHGGLLGLGFWQIQCRAPIVAADRPSWRCHLVTQCR